jgi:hypothetical protein
MLSHCVDAVMILVLSMDAVTLCGCCHDSSLTHEHINSKIPSLFLFSVSVKLVCHQLYLMPMACHHF